MKILIVAPYVTFPGEPGANRFVTIAKLLSQKYDVTLLTSRFCHFLKKHREITPNLEGVKVILIDEPGYKKNVSVSRFYSHFVFCEKFKCFIKDNAEKFDIVYSAYPLIKTNFILGRQKPKFKLILDIQDVWPESITGAIPFLSGSLGSFLMYPITMYANKVYSYADALVSVSKTYMERADINNLDVSLKEVIYIGADNLNFKSTLIENKEELVVSYIGTMGGSYDLETVIRASKLCISPIKFQFIGTGPDEERLKLLNNTIGGKVNFLGALPYRQAIEILKLSDIAINPIKSTAQQSITNKLSDYFCCGLPILSCQDNKEVKQLLSFGGGIYYKSGDPEYLAQILNSLYNNREELNKMSNINKMIAERDFLRSSSYARILSLINRLQ